MDSGEPVAPPAKLTLVTSPSLACDLSWVLSIAGTAAWHSEHPKAAEAFDGREDLAQRVAEFWADEDPDTFFNELLALAHHAGALTETSPDALWAALERAVATVPTDLALESETPEDRAICLRRLELLKASPSLVTSYISLLSEVWAPIDETWQANRPLLEEAGRRAVLQIEKDGSVNAQLAPGCDMFQSMLPIINTHVTSGYPLMVAPCYFFGKSLYLEFPGLTLVGSGFQQNDLGARARTEPLARRLKTVADPTRLALLHYLASAPSTVGDLATSFGLAQPTVSMHVKSLREAGLVRAERSDGRLRLSAEPDAIDALVDELRRVAQGARSTGSVRMPATVVEDTRSDGPVMA